MTVYHPASWASDWPKDAKPFASKAVAVAHGHTEESLIESAYIGSPSDVISEAPTPLSVEEQAFVSANPGAAMATVVPEEPSQAQEVAQAPSSETLSPVKKTSKKSKK